MLKIKYHPGGVALNGPAFECFASRVVLAGHECLVVTSSVDSCSAIAAAVAALGEEPPSAPAHVLLGQPPWYMNETKENTLEDVLPQLAPSEMAEDIVRKRPNMITDQNLAPPTRRKGFFS